MFYQIIHPPHDYNYLGVNDSYLLELKFGTFELKFRTVTTYSMLTSMLLFFYVYDKKPAFSQIYSKKYCLFTLKLLTGLIPICWLFLLTLTGNAIVG